MGHESGTGVDDVREPALGRSRRRVLALGAGLGAVGLLAACGGSDGQAAPGGSSASDGEASAPADGGGGGGALVAAADVPVGGGVILEDKKVVVTQPTQGTFKGFTAVCTHQGCIVSGVKEGVISCACHGSAFSATDGSVTNGPAKAPLAEIAVTVEGGRVVEA